MKMMDLGHELSRVESWMIRRSQFFSFFFLFYLHRNASIHSEASHFHLARRICILHDLWLAPPHKAVRLC